ncbi:MAG: hypothetical protein ABI990_12945 [Actinomycetota bacterium]
MSSILLLLRLALATAVVLLPGWVVARAVGVRGASATLSWALVVVFGALGVTFFVRGTLTLTLVLLLVAGAAVLPFTRGGGKERAPGWAIVGFVGVVVGLLVWHVAGDVGGDGLFHLARARKLVALHGLSLHRVDEFPDGGLHPGYAFPLWHGFLALVAKVAGVDPARVVLHESTVLAPLALLTSYEAGWALFRRVWAAAAATGGSVALAVFAAGHGGAYTSLALPATVSRQILAPAALAVAFSTIRTPTRGLAVSTAAASFALVVVHPTYALFVLIPFVGFLVVRLAWTREDLRSGGLALGALAFPAAVFAAWLYPILRDTRSVSPGAGEKTRGIVQYHDQLVISSLNSYHLALELFGRTGAVAVAALLLVPLAGLAARRRWAAYVVGGTLTVLALTIVSPLFVPFSDAVSLSQARRFAGFLPFAFAFAGGLGVVAALAGRFVVPIAVAAGITLQLLYPGDFGAGLHGDLPAWPTWVAAGGGLLALGLGFWRRGSRERSAGLAAAVFLLPVAIHGLAHWSPVRTDAAYALTPGLVRALRADVPGGDTVYSDLETSYRIAAYAPVYVCNGPPGHVANTKLDRPYARRRELRRFLRTGDLAIPRRCGARWLVVDRTRSTRHFRLRTVYRDSRYVLYRLRTS